MDGADGPVAPGAQPQARDDGPGMTAQEVRREDATVAWADDYCGAVSELVQSFSTMPDIDPSTPQRASSTSSRLLGVMVKGLDRTLRQLDGLGPAPVAEGEAIKADAVSTYTGIRDRALGAKQQLDAAVDEEQSRAAISAVRTPLEDIGRINLLNGFDTVPALKKAAAKAPSCRQLTTDSGAPRFDPGTAGG
ncbi:hypothetical protein [Prauserella muralis]|nr:hypothetical protein [Prauserella muralis]